MVQFRADSLLGNNVEYPRMHQIAMHHRPEVPETDASNQIGIMQTFLIYFLVKKKLFLVKRKLSISVLQNCDLFFLSTQTTNVKIEP